MPLTKDQLRRAMPLAGPNCDLFLEALNATLAEFDIDKPIRRAAFLAQLAHETGQLSRLVENLNYSAGQLMKTWPTRFPTPAVAKEYERQPAKIANAVYANRMGNGAPDTGDGWRYRGAGAFQLTGKANHQACGAHFGIPVEKVGEWLRTPQGAMRSAGWFWRQVGCNELADNGDMDGISDVINIGRRTRTYGDAIGFKDRLSHFEHMKKVFA